MKMKNIFNILSVLLGGVFVLASCHREDILDTNLPDEESRPIDFSSVYASVDTKTESGAENIPASFKVWASRTARSTTNYNVFGQTGTLVTNAGTATSQKWTYSPVRYWQSGEYNFVAVTPVDLISSGTLTANGLALNFGSWNLSSEIDGLLARSDVSGEVVPLSFGHMLSKISFSAKNVTNIPIEITSVKINGYHKDAASVMLSDSQADWTFNDAPSTVGQEIGLSDAVTLGTTPVKVTSDFLVFSEDCALTVEVTIRHDSAAGGYSKSATITATGWESGLQYDYVINVGPDGISFSEPTVDAWKDNGDTADEGIDF